MSENKVLRVFKSTIKSCQYICKDGQVIHFINGVYYTDKEAHIKELEEEIAAGVNAHLYIDTKEKEINALDVDPVAKLKRLAVEEFLAAQAAATNPDNDAGNYVNTAANILNSRTAAVTAKESTSAKK